MVLGLIRSDDETVGAVENGRDANGNDVNDNDANGNDANDK